jgi:ubiquinone/menaquinone biosynthesis C-methylase UbiE
MPTPDRYSHGHHESVLRSHQWRTAQNSAAFLLPRLTTALDVLDVGCGPGTVTIDLAKVVSSGHATGIDLSAEVIEVARKAAHDRGVNNVEFSVDDAYGLSFADHTFDVVYAHQVLQHLSDPVAALKEMRRVLRQGGLLAVREGDHSAFSWSPDDPQLDRWMEIYQQLTKLNHVDANAGRHLHAWVRRAGFSSLEVSTSNWTYYRPAERAWWGQLWADRVRESEFARQSLEYKLTTNDELQEIAEAFLRWADDEDGFFNVVSTEVLASRETI